MSKKIFSKQNSEYGKDNKLIGAYVPISLYHYITLFTIAHKASNTDLLLSLLDDWKTDNEEDGLDENGLIDIIVNDTLIPNLKTYKGTKSKYTKELEKALEKQKLPKKITSKILKLFLDGTKSK